MGWTRLSATATAGSSQLTARGRSDLARRRPDRRRVDRLRPEPRRGGRPWLGASGTVGEPGEPLAFTHYGELQTIAGQHGGRARRGRTAHPQRQVRGDSATSQEAGYGGHIMGTGGTLRVSGIMLRFMGQKGLMARYPMHWHVMGPVDGQYITGSSVWGSFNRCVTVHGTDNARVEDNVCYDHLGHGYFLEDGAETGNLDRREPGPRHQEHRARACCPPTTGRPPSGSPIPTTPSAATRRRARPGFGFWYALPAAPTGLSTGQPDLPRNTPLREFSDNVAHTNRRGGLHVDDGPRPDGNTETTFYAPTHRPGRRQHAPWWPTSPGSPPTSTPGARCGSGAATIV